MDNSSIQFGSPAQTGTHPGVVTRHAADVVLTDEEIRRLRHDIRGCMHGLMLMVSALETPMSDGDRAEFLGDVIGSSEKMEALMDRMLAAPDAQYRDLE